MAAIAWIDDDHERINDLMTFLRRAGHTISTYKSWAEVREQLEQICQSDAIILDIILPPVDDDPYLGLPILAQLREERGYTRPIIVCSRVKNPDVLRQLHELGVAKILHKPALPSELYDAVIEVLAGEATAT